MPRAPPSRTRVAIVSSPYGTRTMGAMPESCAAIAISQAVSIDIDPCSRSMNSQSKPAAFMTFTMSTLRTNRMPMPIDSSFFFRRALAALTANAILSSVFFVLLPEGGYSS